jgi:hypothetical protein
VTAGLECLLSSVSFFGGLHCIGWNFKFPTYSEQILWRGTSLVITVILLIVASIDFLILAIRDLAKDSNKDFANFGPSHDHPPLHLRSRPSISSCGTSTCFAQEPTTEYSICRQLDQIYTTSVFIVVLLCFRRRV